MPNKTLKRPIKHKMFRVHDGEKDEYKKPDH